MEHTYIGIDLGTTYLKGAVLDLDGLRLGRTERILFPDFVPGLPPGHREVDPSEIVTAVRDLIHRLLPFAPNCDGLVMCTQMHGLVMTDEAGQTLSNAITWQDQRTLEQHPSGRGSFYDVLSQHVREQDRLRLGNDLWASRPLSFLFWLNESGWAHSGRAAHIAKPMPASLADFVVSSLCSVVPSVDQTNGAAYGALDLSTGNWHHDLIRRLGLDCYMWPRIRTSGDLVGVASIDGVSLRCYSPTGDHQCAVLGTLLAEDELSINVSTGSQVGMIARELKMSHLFQTRPYFDQKYLQAVIHIPAGRALNALVRLLSEMAEAQCLSIPDPWDYIARATEEVTHTDLQVNLAFFPSSCGDVGAIDNVREDNLTVGNLFLGAFENMAQNYLSCAERIAPAKQWRRLVFSGGLIHKYPPLHSAILRRFSIGSRFSPSSEDTLLGLLILAQVFSGRTNTITEATELIRGAQAP